MASAFGHAAAAFGFSRIGIYKEANWKLLWLGIFLSILPDFDSVGFLLGVPYDSFWGHRGFTHSIVFALLVSGLCSVLFRFEPNNRWRSFIFLFLSCMSHSLLDALTNGGLGVAFFSPFDNSRYFFPIRPIKVSPINVGKFFRGKGFEVIQSELFWIGLPVLGMVFLGYLFKKQRGN